MLRRNLLVFLLFFEYMSKACCIFHLVLPKGSSSFPGLIILSLFLLPFVATHKQAKMLRTQHSRV